MKLKDLLPIIEDYTMVRITDTDFELDYTCFGIEEEVLRLFGEEDVICVDGYVEIVGAVRVKIMNRNRITYKRRMEPGTLFKNV